MNDYNKEVIMLEDILKEKKGLFETGMQRVLRGQENRGILLSMSVLRAVV